MKNQNPVFVILILCLINLGIGIYIGLQFDKSLKSDKPPIDYWGINYKTQFKKSPYSLSEIPNDTSGYRTIKPGVETEYKPESKIPIQVIKCSTDSLTLILDSLKSQILKIPVTFLTSFQENPKIIYGYFSKDTMTLDLFYPDGKSMQHLYQMDYQNYRYKYSDKTLKAEKIDSKPDKIANRNVSSSIYVNSGMISYTRSPFISMNYEFNWNKLKIETTASYLITPNIPMLSLGAGYKLK
jgi:hypothetical protein